MGVKSEPRPADSKVVKRLVLTAIMAALCSSVPASVAIAASLAVVAPAEAASHRCTPAVIPHKLSAGPKTSCRTAREVERYITRHGGQSIIVERRSYWCNYSGDWKATCTAGTGRWIRVVWNQPLV